MDEVIQQLKDTKSPKRRSAAKKLRKAKVSDAGPHLFEALQKELNDPRTWETQYQMIMALGECDYRPALPFLRELAGKHFDATIIYLALGDAIVRLSVETQNDAEPVMKLLQSRNEMLADGALRAMAMMHMVPSDDQMSKIIEFVSALERDHHLRFWVAAAAPGWEGKKVDEFIRQCANSTRSDLCEAAKFAAKGQYRKWQPL